MHDLMHDLALLVAKDEFLVVNSDCQSIPKRVRHLSFAVANASRNDFSSLLSDLAFILIAINYSSNGDAPDEEQGSGHGVNGKLKLETLTRASAFGSAHFHTAEEVARVYADVAKSIRGNKA
ncbi:hypothetical protein WN943_027440 [Citrus x changshan-huyou]